MTELTVDAKTPLRFSFAFMVLFIICVACSKLGTPLITTFFSFLILDNLRIVKRKWLATIIFTALVVVIFYAFVHFSRQAVAALPDVANKSLPIVVDFLRNHNLDLPFTDLATFKTFALDSIRGQVRDLARFAEVTTKEFVYLIIGMVVAISIYLSKESDYIGREAVDLYHRSFFEVRERFKTLYLSFKTVMGAQIIISLINTFCTATFLFILNLASTPLPYSTVIVVVTFLCGMLPIIGNLISNTVITGVALTQSPQLAIEALVFLIVLHKFEYFLNSKIIGGRIRNPMWLTLLSLLIGERLMGIPGMILAPVILHYMKSEASRLPIRPENSASY